MDIQESKIEDLIKHGFWQDVEESMEYVPYGDTDSAYYVIPDSLIEYDLSDTDRIVSINGFASDRLNEILTNYLCSYLLPKTGIDPSRCKLVFKNEMTAVRGMWLNIKKNYAYLKVAVKGKILSEPSIQVTGLSTQKSDTSELTSTIMQELLDSYVFGIVPWDAEDGSEPEYIDVNKISTNELNRKLGLLGIKVGKVIDKRISDFKLIGLGKNVKWGSSADTYYVIRAMKLFNTIYGSNIFKPMVTGSLIPINLKATSVQSMIDRRVRDGEITQYMDADISRINYICIPHVMNDFEKIKAKSIFEECNIKISGKDIWKGIVNTGINHILGNLQTKAMSNYYER